MSLMEQLEQERHALMLEIAESVRARQVRDLAAHETTLVAQVAEFEQRERDLLKKVSEWEAERQVLSPQVTACDHMATCRSEELASLIDAVTVGKTRWTAGDLRRELDDVAPLRSLGHESAADGPMLPSTQKRLREAREELDVVRKRMAALR